MNDYMSAARAALQRGWALLRVHITDTVNIVRKAYLGTLILVLLVAPILWQLDFPSAAMGLCFVATIVLSILGHIFDARLLIGTAGYKWLRRLSRLTSKGVVLTQTSGGARIIDDRPYLGKLWYWSSFVNMWPPLVTALIGFIAPWEIGMLAYLELLAGITLVLWAVATQLAVGQFWRRIHIATSVTILLCILFANYNHGWYLRMVGEHRRTQMMSVEEERYQQLIATTFRPQLEEIDRQLVQVRYQKSQLAVSHQVIPAWMDRQEQDLESGRQYVLSQIETYSKKVNDAKRAGFGTPIGVFLFVLLAGAGFWALDQLGAFTKTTPAHH